MRYQVQESTKTGFRMVVPLPREWVEQFGLRERRLRPRLAVVDRPDASGKWLSAQIKRQGIPWRHPCHSCAKEIKSGSYRK
jgi:hypothetical protein